MGGNYEKSIYNQLMEVSEKLNTMESEHRQDRKEINSFSGDVLSLSTGSVYGFCRKFAGTFTHDHETALYHFGSGHGECNVHLERYLLKNMEETGNAWSHDLSGFLEGG